MTKPYRQLSAKDKRAVEARNKAQGRKRAARMAALAQDRERELRALDRKRLRLNLIREVHWYRIVTANPDDVQGIYAALAAVGCEWPADTVDRWVCGCGAVLPAACKSLDNGDDACDRRDRRSTI